MEKLKIVYNQHCNGIKTEIYGEFDTKTAQAVNCFHKTFEEYSVTPLAELSDTAKFFGVKGIFVKDESYRFGLNAFKGQGGSYCIGRYFAQLLGEDISELSEKKLTSPEVVEKTGQITFVTATDGNHGRGVAWAAKVLGHKAVVYMPAGSAQERLENIRRLGAHAEITEVNYDDTVRFAKKQAEENGWVLVQDTSWEGYADIPMYIMQGYLTMALEAVNQLGQTVPTHIFLQAGVGSMAGAMTAFFRNVYGDKVKIVIVEPQKADCIYRTAKADDGTIKFVGGDMDTIMAGLACGEPCTIGWEILKNGADAFVSMDDGVAADAMRILASPEGKDKKIISGESGAAGFGAAVEILSRHKDIAEKLVMDENSVILCFSTEGATDVENYRNIVWHGIYGRK